MCWLNLPVEVLPPMRMKYISTREELCWKRLDLAIEALRWEGLMAQTRALASDRRDSCFQPSPPDTFYQELAIPEPLQVRETNHS
jgi:hypothetical protein